MKQYLIKCDHCGKTCNCTLDMNLVVIRTSTELGDIERDICDDCMNELLKFL